LLLAGYDRRRRRKLGGGGSVSIYIEKRKPRTGLQPKRQRTDWTGLQLGLKPTFLSPVFSSS
jgi:hypothetical protein